MFKIETGDNNEILRTKSQEIARIELNKYVKLGKQMIDYLKNPDNGGVGLAAPQIGINKRIIAVSLMNSYEDENYRTIMMINPEILEHSNNVEVDGEGCLSLPGESGEVERYCRIKLQFLDQKGHKNTIILKGLSARIVQHEIDHLDGILFMDRVEK
ncbi:MAG: peptide deformylase [Candidatus Gracilibacteria bacterium]|nr:peptide deformylase [Candidatus Gracilibacteria bacterium]